jgi:hypothetical protein
MSRACAPLRLSLRMAQRSPDDQSTTSRFWVGSPGRVSSRGDAEPRGFPESRSFAHPFPPKRWLGFPCEAARFRIDFMKRPGSDPSRRALAGAAALAVFSCGLAACSSSNNSPGASTGDASAGNNGAGGNSAGASSSGGNGPGAGGNRPGAGGRSPGAGGNAQGAGGTAVAGPVDAKTVAQKLGRTHFLVGMGNDLNNDHNQDGAYTLGVTMDLHYAYMVGLMGEGGWPDWNQGGTFVNILSDSAKANGVVPMYTLYAMAAHGEGNAGALTDDSYMQKYWDGAKLLFQRIAAFGDPAVVQFEPDFWAFMERQNSDPTAMAVHVTSLAPDCASLPDNAVGMGKCLVALGRKYAPKAVIGFHVSSWGGDSPDQIVTYMKAIGAAEGDLITTDMLDRDAGCYEAHTDPNCQRTSTGVYWDETNTTSPNYREHLDWVKAIVSGIGRPMLWWQVPFGVPSDTPGGTAGHYRDNRVHYIFGHIGEFVAAGGLGVTFGTGAGNQTYIDSDGDQFKNAVTAYFASPVTL